MTINPKVFLIAAKKLGVATSASGTIVNCCCDAIDHEYNSSKNYITFSHNLEEKKFFSEWFKPKECISPYWWTNPAISIRDQQARLLALLFTYHIAKDELK